MRPRVGSRPWHCIKSKGSTQRSVERGLGCGRAVDRARWGRHSAAERQAVVPEVGKAVADMRLIFLIKAMVLSDRALLRPSLR
jgi:predicted Fe-S protein YdhL (DUF1289 family)